MQDFRRLLVWRKAFDLALTIYAATQAFPSAERYGLNAQMRRAAISVPSNIAEGTARGSDLDFARFLQQAMGSAAELECQILLARELGYLSAEQSDPLESAAVEVKKMLAALIARLRR